MGGGGIGGRRAGRGSVASLLDCVLGQCWEGREWAFDVTSGMHWVVFRIFHDFNFVIFFRHAARERAREKH